MPKRKYVQSRLSDYMPSKRVRATLALLPAKRRQAVSRRRPLIRRRTTYRRIRRKTLTSRRPRPSRGFVRKVLEASSRLNTYTVDSASNTQGAVGTQQISSPPGSFNISLHNAITGQIKSTTPATELPSRISYFLQKAITRSTFLNAHAAKVHAVFYYIVARRATTQDPVTAYTLGFNNDGPTGSGLNSQATPFMSSDFTSNYRIYKIHKRVLEQGEHYTGSVSSGPFKVDNDKWGVSGTNQKGVRFIFAMFNGTLGIDSTNSALVTTSPTSILTRNTTTCTYRLLSDMSANYFTNTTLSSSVLASNFRFANSDTGAAVTGTANNL